MIVRYEGWPGTGLRLEKPNDSSYCIDVSGRKLEGPMELFVCAGKGQQPGTMINLEPEDVARLAVMCNQWLTWHFTRRPEPK
jgi:hypothetical protein